MSWVTVLRLHCVYATQTYFKVDANAPKILVMWELGPMENLMLENSHFEVFVASSDYIIHEKYFAAGNILEPGLNSYFSTHCFAITDVKLYPSMRTGSKK